MMPLGLAQKQLQERLKPLEIAIQEAKQRRPANSIKPAMMAGLLELEDERKTIMTQIRKLKEQE